MKCKQKAPRVVVAKHSAGFELFAPSPTVHGSTEFMYDGFMMREKQRNRKKEDKNLRKKEKERSKRIAIGVPMTLHGHGSFF